MLSKNRVINVQILIKEGHGFMQKSNSDSRKIILVLAKIIIAICYKSNTLFSDTPAP